jgi:hypothetical protein
MPTRNHLDRAAELPDSLAKAIECFNLSWTIGITKTSAIELHAYSFGYVSAHDYLE